LLAVAEARNRILRGLIAVEPELVSLNNCLNRVLSEEVESHQDFPLFSHSGMDGFAVIAEDTAPIDKSAVTIKVIGDIPAGSFPEFSLKSGTAARIMTGAMLPGGADAVVPVENTDQYLKPKGGYLPDWVRINKPVLKGDNIRLKGQDIHAGQIVLDANKRIKSQDIGLLALLGLTDVPVFRLPRIVILTTGDELIPLGAPLRPGKIRDVNTYSISALIRENGAEVIPLGIIPDEPAIIRQALHSAIAEKADLILTSAGISVGEFDYVKDIIEEKGSLEFWRVNMRPGKPIAFGKYQGIPIIGLPGNPVSTFICSLVFVVPAIKKLGGLPITLPTSIKAILAEDIESDGRESYLRAVVNQMDQKLFVKLTGHQGSGNILSISQANSLLIVPSGVKSLPAGAEVTVWMIADIVS